NKCIQTYAWKPNKDNKPVQRFISRMKAKHSCKELEAQQIKKNGLIPEPYIYQIPEPGERFEYVVVENGKDHNENKKIQRETLWSIPQYFTNSIKKLNVDYYLKSVASLCACFINYYDCFQPPENPEILKMT